MVSSFKPGWPRSGAQNSGGDDDRIWGHSDVCSRHEAWRRLVPPKLFRDQDMLDAVLAAIERDRKRRIVESVREWEQRLWQRFAQNTLLRLLI